ncbi:MAG TPA: T9SS type A sorting domain-containing protein [Saprospiraceae bacterium]|nr:T9SS type A sorting domain-containing protein [Saprospiraceae bacterium]
MKNLKFDIFVYLGCSLIFFFNTIKAQNLGVVQSPIVWKTFDGSADFEKYGNDKFNYNSYKYFDNQKDNLELDIKSLKKVSMFLVFSSNNDGRVLFIDNNENEILLLRDNSVKTNKTIGYSETFDKPKILSIQDVLSHGEKLSTSKLMVESKGRHSGNYSGGISEVIVYDKLLKKRDREKIESYLSLKYGIPLLDTSTYYRSDGGIFWDGKTQEPYQHHLAGICRDDVSKLYQKQSKSVYSDISLTFGLDKIYDHNKSNFAKIDNFESFIWADDNNNIDFSFVNTEMSQMNRKWTIQNSIASNDIENVHLKIDFSHSKNFNAELDSYLVLSDNDKFDENSGFRFIKLSNVNNVSFECNIDFNLFKDNKLKYFTFRQLPKLVVNSKAGNLCCAKKVGEIILDAESRDISGLNFKIVNSRGEEIRNGNFTSFHHLIADLPFDIYDVQIYKGKVLRNSQSITLDEKRCSDEIKTLLYPNPVYLGSDFNVETNEFSMEQVDVEILNSIGQIIYTNKFQVEDYLIFNHSIQATGIYKVRIKSKTKEKTLDVVIIE